jgi:NAD(P)-dependent dehydrogenase (short-subunit alcohol dehydrogenase family)
MRILVVGATGTIGKAVVSALSARHEVIAASHNRAAERVDISSIASIRALFDRVGKVDAIVSAAGSAKFAPFASLTDADFQYSIDNKLMGQANLARIGIDVLNQGGSITLTSGILAQQPMPGSGAISLVNAGLEGFTRAAGLEAPRGIRVNCVSPPWVSETLTGMGMNPSGGLPAATVAQSYVESVEGSANGRIFELSAPAA